MNGKQMPARLDYNQIAPDGARALGSVYAYVMKSDLPTDLIDLVYLRVSQINNCAYCLDMHTRDLLKRGVSVEKIALVQAWKEGGDLFSETERAALRWTEAVTLIADTGAPEGDYSAARAIFGEKQLVDLTIAITLMNAYDRLAIGFRKEPLAAITI